MAVHYTEDRSNSLLGEAWFEEYVATADTHSPERMRRDAVSELRHLDVSSDLYGNAVRVEVTVTDSGTGFSLFLDREGVYVRAAPETTVEVPDAVEACLDRVAFRRGYTAGCTSVKNFGALGRRISVRSYSRQYHSSIQAATTRNSSSPRTSSAKSGTRRTSWPRKMSCERPSASRWTDHRR